MARRWLLGLGVVGVALVVACSSAEQETPRAAEQIDEAIQDQAPVPAIGSTVRNGRFAVVISACEGEPVATKLTGQLIDEAQGASSLTEEDLGALMPVEVSTAGVAMFEAADPAVLDAVPAPFTQRLVEVALSVDAGGAGVVSVASEDPPDFPDLLVADFPERRTVSIEDFANCD